MSTEQRDKALGALGNWARPDRELKSKSDGYSYGFRLGFNAGWDAHAATMPDREALKASLWTKLEEALAEGPLFDMNDPRERLGFDKLMGETADAVLALLNKEGEE